MSIKTSLKFKNKHLASTLDPYECLSLDEKREMEKRLGVTPSLDFLNNIVAHNNEESGLGSETWEWEKLSSAKEFLRDFNNHYETVFTKKAFSTEEDNWERLGFYNSNLLYLIASTDGNEDSIGHSQLVAKYTMILTKAMGIEDQDFLMNIERGAALHDIGKICISDAILKKEGTLSKGEIEIIKEHPLLGYEMIEEFDFLKKAARVVLFHHEQFGGSGYPYGLVGQEIPLEARIFALADTLDAITSDRPYRKGDSFKNAFREIEKGRGKQFDPFITDIFLMIPEEKWMRVKAETKDILNFISIH